tara:strand:- start:816 stop:1250 length:435 start_codon:yes stop_codon:yes gene_type:complete
MKKIDPHTLFSLFEANDEQVYEENNVTEVLQNPYVLMGMVVRGVDNFFLLDKIYSKNHKEEYLRSKDRIKHKYFSKLYTYLERIKSDKFETKYIIGETFDSGEVNKSLHTMLYYFENLEEYEKCAVIKKYIDLLYEKPNVRLHI